MISVHMLANRTNPEVFVPEEVAAMLHCSVKTIEERTRRGDLPGLKFGDGWVFPAVALFQRLNEQALEEARERGRPAPRESTAVLPQVKRKKTPPTLPEPP